MINRVGIDDQTQMKGMDTVMENVTLSKKANSKVENKKDTNKTETNFISNKDSKSKEISEDIDMLISGMIQKNGKSFSRVSFMRGQSWAEGIVPDGIIEKSEGFSEEEIAQLTAYLVQEKNMILEQAKGVNPLKNIFGI